MLGSTPAVEPAATSGLLDRAAAGTALLAGKGIAVQVVGLGGTFVFARALGPKGLGVVTLGFSVAALAALLAGGQALGSALIRAHDTPTHADFAALLGLHLLLVSVVGGVGAAAALAFGGHPGRVAALMLLGLPFAAIRGPAVVSLERMLAYRSLAAAEAVESLVYYGWGVVGIGLGGGVWTVAAGAPAGALAATVLIIRLAPEGIPAPRVSIVRWRALLSFGARLQAQQLVQGLRNEGVNLGIAAIAGLPALGIWRLAAKILRLPQTVFGPMLRVSLPALSTIVRRGADPRARLERLLAFAAIVNGLILVSIVTTGPALVASVFGPTWSPAVDGLAAAAPGLLLVVPIGATFNGYLWAVGDASTPLRAALASAIVWPVVALPLLPPFGLFAVGLGLSASALAHSLVLAAGVRRHLGPGVVAALRVPVAAAVVAGVAGFVVGAARDTGLVSAALGEAVALGVYTGALLGFARGTAAEAARLGGHAVRGLRGGSSA